MPLTEDKLHLKWEHFETNINSSLKELRAGNDFFDVTLACEDQSQVSAHKVILSACSPLFRTILRRNPHQHPLIYLKGIKYKELVGVLDFMYNGEVNVVEEELSVFLAAAEDLSIKGLTVASRTLGGKRAAGKESDTPPINSRMLMKLPEPPDITQSLQVQIEVGSPQHSSTPPPTTVKEEPSYCDVSMEDGCSEDGEGDNDDSDDMPPPVLPREGGEDSASLALSCFHCSLTFSQQMDLLLHSLVHSADGSPSDGIFSCRRCSDTFPEVDDLRSHYLTIHSGEDTDRGHICLLCGKGFASAGKRQIHERMHTGEKPFECPYCTKRFSQSQHLNTHIKIHTGERDYKCTWCGKQFIDSGKLKRHTMTHTGEKPHVCGLCGKSYTDPRGLRRHAVIHSRNTDEGS